jgi:hypothetical protein
MPCVMNRGLTCAGAPFDLHSTEGRREKAGGANAAARYQLHDDLRRLDDVRKIKPSKRA